MQFVKKPVIISAEYCEQEQIIHTLEGNMKASKGDWIITGIKGERYPCKPDIFEQTYVPGDKEAELKWNEVYPENRKQTGFA